jgi:hypothetical protein
LIAIGMLGGCMIVSPPKRDAVPGDDPLLLETGASRAAVEQAMGKPLRVWSPNNQVSYGLYKFHDPLEAWEANRGIVVAAEVITFGTIEADRMIWDWEAKQNPEDLRCVTYWWIGFDRWGKVFGHYSQFEILPEHPPQQFPTASVRP